MQRAAESGHSPSSGEDPCSSSDGQAESPFSLPLPFLFYSEPHSWDCTRTPPWGVPAVPRPSIPTLTSSGSTLTDTQIALLPDFWAPHGQADTKLTLLTTGPSSSSHSAPRPVCGVREALGCAGSWGPVSWDEQRPGLCLLSRSLLPQGTTLPVVRGLLGTPGRRSGQAGVGGRVLPASSGERPPVCRPGAMSRMAASGQIRSCFGDRHLLHSFIYKSCRVKNHSFHPLG